MRTVARQLHTIRSGKSRAKALVLGDNFEVLLSMGGFDMQRRYRRFHSDGSEAIVYESYDRWQVQLVIPHVSGGPSIVAREGSTLDEAKRAADLAVEHHCNQKCGKWVLSIPDEEKQLRLWDRLLRHV